MKVLLFEDEEYKESIFRKLQYWQNFKRLYVKNRLKTDYDKVYGLI
jgi:hypothetical protein